MFGIRIEKTDFGHLVFMHNGGTEKARFHFFYRYRLFPYQEEFFDFHKQQRAFVFTGRRSGGARAVSEMLKKAGYKILSVDDLKTSR